MDATAAIALLQRGHKPSWPSNAATLDFAASLDAHPDIPRTLRDDFVVPTKAQLRRKTLHDDPHTSAPASSPEDEAIYFCGNSLGLQPKAVATYLPAYLQTWASIAVGGHFTTLHDSPLVAYQDMAADCARKMAPLVGAHDPAEVVAMNSLTVNLHLLLAAFYRPDKTTRKTKILCEWRPFPSDWYVIESQIEWHGLDPTEEILLARPEEGAGAGAGYELSTESICQLISEHREELALVLLPGIQYYSGQLLEIPTITAHARACGVTVGWDLAHAVGNVELELHDWGVDFACWCTYKYLNAGAGAIAGAFVHERHGDSRRNGALKGWYGHEKSSRFLMDNRFVPTPGAGGFQVSNPSVVDLTCLSAALSVYEKTSMEELRRRALLLTAYAEELLGGIARRNATGAGEEAPFTIITPRDPRHRGTQLSVLFQEELMEEVSAALEENGVICDKRKPGIIRVAPVPLYNTFGDVARFMQIVEGALKNKRRTTDDSE